MNRVTVLLAYAAMVLIWGTTWLGIKFGLRSLPPVTGVGLRFVLAAAFLYGCAIATNTPIRSRQLPIRLILVLATCMFGINYVLTYIAETRLSSGLVAVLFGTLPFFTFGMGHVLVHERTTVQTWMGAFVAFLGVAVISLTGSVHASLPYALAAIGAAAIAGFANVYLKRHSARAPLEVLPPSMLLAGGVLAVAGLLFEHVEVRRAFSVESLAALAYLAVFGSGVAFFLNHWLLQRVDAWIVALSALLIPVLAVCVGVVLGGETFGARDLIGAVLVVGGVWIALSRRRVDLVLTCEG
ncbi:MAG: EamA family transporter [Candidatus Eremiobacteraeota bacterium]|nr:EamA family transporter [Candidatus Eremiobacteraeota bacterium]